jgi:predicted RND superfamily exporter protein
MPAIEQEVGTVSFPDGVSVHLAGMGPMDAANREQMEAEMGFTTIAGFILVFVVASLFYRSALVGIIAITPIVLALVWTISTMGLIDLPFTALSVTIFTMVMGIGIDYSIHLVHRIKEERRSRLRRFSLSIGLGERSRSASSSASLPRSGWFPRFWSWRRGCGRGDGGETGREEP